MIIRINPNTFLFALWRILHSFTILTECNIKTDGWRRIQRTHIIFDLYEVCRNGDWVKETCESTALFWTILSCCIPLSKYPAQRNCIANSRNGIWSHKRDNEKTTLIDTDAKSYMAYHTPPIFKFERLKYN